MIWTYGVSRCVIHAGTAYAIVLWQYATTFYILKQNVHQACFDLCFDL